MTTVAPPSALAPSASHDAGRFTDDWVIDVANVEKVYKGRFGRNRVHALRGIDMRVHRGSVFGLLGPNGAGKSTLVKILMTVIRPTRCEGAFLGAPVGHKPTLKRVGYLPEHHRFPEYLTAEQVLDYFGALSDVPRAQRRRRAAELLDLVGLKNWSRARVRGFSKGMRQRLGIANALMSDPDLVILDEPTDGVDPVGRRDIRNILTRIRDEGRTVFLNSHLLSELEMVCDRVAILVQGVVASQGTIEELTRDSRRYEIDISLPGAAGSSPADFLPKALVSVARFAPLLPATPRDASNALALHGTLTVNGDEHPTVVLEPVQGTNGLTIKVGSTDAAIIQPIIDALRAHNTTIRAIRPVRASLEDLFMNAVVDPQSGQALAPGAASIGKREAGNAATAGLGAAQGVRQ